MKLSDVMTNHGWVSCDVDEGYQNLKVYQKDNLLFGIQKIGNVFRLDLQQVINFGDVMFPGDKMLDNQIVPRDMLEPTLNDLLPQLT